MEGQGLNTKVESEYVIQNQLWCCGICLKVFVDEASWEEHMSDHVNDELIICNICGREFVNKGTFSRHKRNHVEMQVYPCQYCEMFFATKCGRASHMRIHDKQERKYVCSHCTRQYMYKYHLESHLRQICVNMQIECVCCSVEYESYVDLQTHMFKEHNCTILGCVCAE